jgi:hypothetical protein
MCDLKFCEGALEVSFGTGGGAFSSRIKVSPEVNPLLFNNKLSCVMSRTFGGYPDKTCNLSWGMFDTLESCTLRSLIVCSGVKDLITWWPDLVFTRKAKDIADFLILVFV